MSGWTDERRCPDGTVLVASGDMGPDDAVPFAWPVHVGVATSVAGAQALIAEHLRRRGHTGELKWRERCDVATAADKLSQGSHIAGYRRTVVATAHDDDGDTWEIHLERLAG